MGHSSLSRALLSIGDTFDFNGLPGQDLSSDMRLKVEGITPTGDVILAVSMGSDEPYVTNAHRVTYLTAITLIEEKVWTEARI